MEERKKKLAEQPNEIRTTELPKVPTSMFLNYNQALGPPYRILLDTNFINFSIQNKLDIFKESMDCLLGKCELDKAFLTSKASHTFRSV